MITLEDEKVFGSYVKVKSRNFITMISKENKQLLLQYTAGIIASLTVVGYGCLMSWTSPALPHLTSEKSEFPVTETQGAWIASLVNVGMIFGYIINALIIDNIGRKKTLLVLAIPQIIACISIVLARSWLVLYLSRIIIGIGYGGGLCATNTYLGEIGSQNNRGIFLSLIKLSLNFGIFFVMFLGAYLTYNTMNLVLLSLPLIFLVSFPFMPDSFHFLEKKGESLYTWNNKEKNESRLKNLFCMAKNRKALIIVCLIFATENLSGHGAVMAYTQEIFDYSPSSISAEYATLIFGGAKIIATLFSTQIIERVDRKVLFLGSGILATMAQLITAIFFLMKFNFKVDVSSVSWVPIFAITTYEFVGNIGIGIMGFVYSGELFSPDVRGLGTTFTYIVFDGLSFLVKLQFYAVVHTIGISGTFFLFSALCIIGTGIVFYIAPETRGKSLEEIQTILETRKKKDRV